MQYDLIVIGSGPAGQKAAIAAAKQNWRVAVVERQRELLGGVCLHTGTIPSKTIREAILHLTGYRHRDVYDERYRRKREITMDDLRRKMVATSARTSGRSFRTSSPATASTSSAARRRSSIRTASKSPAAAKAQTLDGRQHPDRHRHQAVAARPHSVRRRDGLRFRRNPQPGPRAAVDDRRRRRRDRPRIRHHVRHARRAGDRRRRPRAAARILRPRNHRHAAPPRPLAGHGLPAGRKRRRHSRAAAGPGGRRARKRQAAAWAKRCCSASAAAATRSRLRLERAGLDADKRGRLKCNEHFQTDVPHIYAVGDVVGFPALASTSMEQGRRAVCHMMGETFEPCQHMPYGLFTIPEISMVGKNEEAAHRANACRTKSASPATAKSPAARSPATTPACSSCCSTARRASCSAST